MANTLFFLVTHFIGRPKLTTDVHTRRESPLTYSSGSSQLTAVCFAINCQRLDDTLTNTNFLLYLFSHLQALARVGRVLSLSR